MDITSYIKIQKDHLLLKGQAHDNSTLLSKRFVLSKDLQYDVSYENGMIFGLPERLGGFRGNQRWPY